MTETPWQVVGRFVKERRERLGLKQEELQLYGGPKVSTVGKIERAAQDAFPLRTQHAAENALGWDRGSIEDLLDAAGRPDWERLWESDYYERLVVDDPPDLSRPSAPTQARRAAELSDEELLAEVAYRFTAYSREAESVRQQLANAVAMNHRFAASRLSVVDDNVSEEIAAHDEETPISGEQGQPEDA